eukprot:scaffold68251_cov23-Tisochrysis_lutea.AAC.3
MLRQGKGHMPWGQGKIEDTEGESTYSEYFWAKDLVRYVEANPGKLDFALPRGKGAHAPLANTQCKHAYVTLHLVVTACTYQASLRAQSIPLL